MNELGPSYASALMLESLLANAEAYLGLKTEGRTGRENTSTHSQAEGGAGGEGAIRVFTGEHLEPPYLVYDRFHYQLSNRGGGGFLATGRTVGGERRQG